MSRASLVLVVATLAACSKPAPAIILDANAPDATASIVDASVVDADAAVDASSDDYGPLWTWDDDCDAPLPDPKSAKSIGHTSVVFKLELENGKKAVFKPHSKKGPNRYKGEVAAWRLAKLLDVKHVVFACARTIPKAKMEAALAGRRDAATLFSEQAIVEDGGVRGAVIPWVDDLGFVGLEKEPLNTSFRTWLKNGQRIPPDRQDGFTPQTSLMIVFDYITGNWDRLSGGNVGSMGSGEKWPPVRLLFIDNDGAFFENPPKDGLARNKRLLEGTDRFSKGLIARLRTLDEDQLRSAFGKDSDGKPLLSDKVIAGVASRAKEVVAHVDAKIEKYGESEVLCFP